VGRRDHSAQAKRQLSTHVSRKQYPLQNATMSNSDSPYAVHLNRSCSSRIGANRMFRGACLRSRFHTASILCSHLVERR
jgi:hypothetical protein